MNEEEKKAELMRKHKRVKMILRIVGLTLLVGGLTCTIIGFVDFFSSMLGEEMGMPKLFFLLFIGLPCMGIGGAMTLMSAQRGMARYVKNETAPVFNELGEDISPGIKSIADAVKGDTPNATNKPVVYCSACGTPNDTDAKFCKSCGKAMND